MLRTSRTIQGALSIGAFVATMVYTYTSKSAKDEDAALFGWDEDNVSHVRGNGVEPHEAEEAVLDPGRVSAPAYNISVTARVASDREKCRYRTQGK